MDQAVQEALSGIVTEIVDADDPKELAKLLLALQALRAALSDTIDEATDKLYGLLKKKETDLGEGIGVVARVRDTKVAWNHDELYAHIVKRHREVDPDTGEVTVDGVALADELKSLLAFAYWRKTALRERKIDPGEFSTTIYGRPRIRFLSKEGHA